MSLQKLAVELTTEKDVAVIQAAYADGNLLYKGEPFKPFYDGKMEDSVNTAIYENGPVDETNTFGLYYDQTKDIFLELIAVTHDGPEEGDESESDYVSILTKGFDPKNADFFSNVDDFEPDVDTLKQAVEQSHPDLIAIYESFH